MAAEDRTRAFDVALGRRALAEGVGAFALVFAGCGAVITNAGPAPVSTGEG